jgi:hypothetical protein
VLALPPSHRLHPYTPRFAGAAPGGGKHDTTREAGSSATGGLRGRVVSKPPPKEVLYTEFVIKN